MFADDCGEERPRVSDKIFRKPIHSLGSNQLGMFSENGVLEIRNLEEH